MGPDRSGNFVPLPLQILPAHRGTISSQGAHQGGHERAERYEQTTVGRHHVTSHGP